MYKAFTSFVENNQSIDENLLNDLLPQKKNQSRIMISEEIGDSATDSMPNTISQTNNNIISTKFSIDKIKNNHIQGLEEYTKLQIKNITTNYIKNALGYANVQADIVGMEIIGSRNRGTARLDGDLDIVVELKGDNLREDDLFNLLNDNDEPLEINGIKVDINPIIVEKSGSLEEFMKRSNTYDKEHTRYSVSEEKNDYELWQDELNETLEKEKSVDENFYNDMKKHFNDYDGKSGVKLADGIMTSMK